MVFCNAIRKRFTSRDVGEETTLKGVHVHDVVKVVQPRLSSLLSDESKHYQGGGGARTLVNQRFGSSGFLRDKYWKETMFSLRGRAMPIMPQLIYLAYSCLAVFTVIEVNGKEYKTLPELKALQFPIQAIGTALFLLLAFRTNSCYDRWWEGRKLWDGISSKCIDTTRMVQTYVLHKSPAAAHRILKWTLAVPYANKWNLRRKKVMSDVTGFLDNNEIVELAASDNPVMFCIQRLSDAAAMTFEAPVSCPVVIAGKFDTNAAGLVTDCAACARIVTTPMPFAYIVHLRSFMVLWLAALPFALVGTFGWHCVYITGVIGYQLLGFEEIGVEIESPFGRDFNDIPLDVIIRDLSLPVEDVMKRAIKAEGEAAAEAARKAGVAAHAYEEEPDNNNDNNGHGPGSD